MQSGKEADLCVVSYSDLNYDARSTNLIDFYLNKGLKVTTYSISKSNSNRSNALVYKVNTKNRFLINWIKFLWKGIVNRKYLQAKTYFAADLYSLVLLRLMFIRPSLIVYDSREIFSALGTLQKQVFKQKILALIEKLAIRKIKKIVVSGELDAEYLRNYFIDQQINYYVVKNLPKEVKIVKSNYLRDKFSIPSDKIILIYQGVLLDGRGIKPILSALDQTDKFVLVIVGDGTYKTEIQNLIVKKNLGHKVFLHHLVNYDGLLNITASADIGISLIEPITFSYELALPNKVFEYVYAGLPVLVSDLPAMKQFVIENDVGEIVPITLSSREIIDALNKLTANLEKYRTSISEKKENFTYHSQADTLSKLLD